MGDLNSQANIWQGIGNSFTGNLDYKRQQRLQADQFSFNRTEAEKNRDFQERMSNSAYQRAAADMKAAGFNPALSVASSAGASTPSGATASGSAGSASRTDGLSAVLGIVNSAIKLGKFL